jgi:hypothetical protein
LTARLARAGRIADDDYLRRVGHAIERIADANRTMYQDGVLDIRARVEDWQMQCFGEPFAVSDEVLWRLRDPESEWLQRAGRKGSRA